LVSREFRKGLRYRISPRHPSSRVNRHSFDKAEGRPPGMMPSATGSRFSRVRRCAVRRHVGPGLTHIGTRRFESAKLSPRRASCPPAPSEPDRQGRISSVARGVDSAIGQQQPRGGTSGILQGLNSSSQPFRYMSAEVRGRPRSRTFPRTAPRPACSAAPMSVVEGLQGQLAMHQISYALPAPSCTVSVNWRVVRSNRRVCKLVSRFDEFAHFPTSRAAAVADRGPGVPASSLLGWLLGVLCVRPKFILRARVCRWHRRSARERHRSMPRH
jgi:hypothetical protein